MASAELLGCLPWEQSSAASFRSYCTDVHGTGPVQLAPRRMAALTAAGCISLSESTSAAAAVAAGAAKLVPDLVAAWASVPFAAYCGISKMAGATISGLSTG